ncbi:MAG: GGDEF domain-containing protein [Betaproteobacteria bacterium]|nr:GGDEF domain-containing protein [Betaproteobacteria bacterium]
MKSNLIFDPELSREELKGFSRTIAEIEWLLLILVLVYQLKAVPDEFAATALSMAMFFYAAFVLLFRYVNVYRREAYWKLAVETGMMIVFITWVLFYTGKLASPLVNLYLLVVITSSLALGRMATVVAMVVIATCMLWLDYPRSQNILLASYGVDFLGRIAPLALVAYVTTMLSADTRRAMGEIKTLSETDDLTGILNRRAFLSSSAHTVNLSQRYGRDFSIIMMDSDSLKAVNDANGHEAGDELLKAMVMHAQQELRRPDLLARYGGDEFVLLLPDTNAEGARLTAERIRERIESMPLAVGNKRVDITASMGVASYPEHGADYEQVLEAADAALYASKSRGKNRVTVAQRAASMRAVAS